MNTRAALASADLDALRFLMRGAGVEALRMARDRARLTVTFKDGPSDPVSACDLLIEAHSAPP